MTYSPASINRSTRWEPKKAAPPVTRFRVVIWNVLSELVQRRLSPSPTRQRQARCPHLLRIGDGTGTNTQAGRRIRPATPASSAPGTDAIRSGSAPQRHPPPPPQRTQPAQITGLASPQSLGLGRGVHRNEHHVRLSDLLLHCREKWRLRPRARSTTASRPGSYTGRRFNSGSFQASIRAWLMSTTVT